jgi:hypothetical protein
MIPYMLVMLIGAVPALLLRWVLLRRPLNFWPALGVTFLILIGLVAIWDAMGGKSQTPAGAASALSFFILWAGKRAKSETEASENAPPEPKSPSAESPPPLPAASPPPLLAAPTVKEIPKVPSTSSGLKPVFWAVLIIGALVGYTLLVRPDLLRRVLPEKVETPSPTETVESTINIWKERASERAIELARNAKTFHEWRDNESLIRETLGKMTGDLKVTGWNATDHGDGTYLVQYQFSINGEGKSFALEANTRIGIVRNVMKDETLRKKYGFTPSAPDVPQETPK